MCLSKTQTFYSQDAHLISILNTHTQFSTQSPEPSCPATLHLWAICLQFLASGSTQEFSFITNHKCPDFIISHSCQIKKKKKHCFVHKETCPSLVLPACMRFSNSRLLTYSIYHNKKHTLSAHQIHSCDSSTPTSWPPSDGTQEC